jgi:hypothetical protein
MSSIANSYYWRGERQCWVKPVGTAVPGAYGFLTKPSGLSDAPFPKEYLSAGSSLCRTAMLLATAKLGKDERKHFSKSLQLNDSLEKLCVATSI